MAEVLPGTVLERGRVAPGVEMTDAATGERWSAWDFRNRRAAVVCFVHPGCSACEAFVASLDAEELRRGDARAVAVAEAPERFLGPDPELPVIVVLDRYAAAWRSFPATGHDFPDPGEVVATVWHLATMCPECGVSTWE